MHAKARGHPARHHGMSGRNPPAQRSPRKFIATHWRKYGLNLATESELQAARDALLQEARPHVQGEALLLPLRLFQLRMQQLLWAAWWNFRILLLKYCVLCCGSLVLVVHGLLSTQGFDEGSAATKNAPRS